MRNIHKTGPKLIALVSFLIIGVISWFAPNIPNCLTAVEAAPAPQSFSQLAKEVGPKVVNIATVKKIKPDSRPFKAPFDRDDSFEEFFRKFFGDRIPREYKQRGLGTGFIIDPDGLVITNNHVVANADQIEIRLSTEESYDAEIIGRDPKTDLALIKIKTNGPFPHLVLGDSDKIEVGDWVIAVGNPFGLENTVTAGIISAKQRNIGAGPYDDFLQTDASINPGNSGGPLLNMKGEVIGINTAIVATGQGIGFAIPSNIAKTIVNQLKSRGKVVRGWLGVMIQKITPELVKSFSLKDDKGALVADVPEGSPADKAGIKRGDVIVEFDNSKIEEWSDLPQIVASTEVGKQVTVKIVRDGNEKVFDVELGELKEEESQEESPETSQEKRLGMTVEEITPELAAKLGIDEKTGVIVTGVDEAGPASEAGLRPGDILKEIQREPVESISDYSHIMKNLPSSGNILFLIKRGTNTFFVTLDLG